MKTTVMRNFSIYLCFIFCASFSLNAQEHANCGTEFSSEAQAYYESIKSDIERVEQEFLANQAFQRNSSAVISVPIKAHIIRTSAGFGGLSVTALNDAIANMNNYYANANLSFYLCDGINYIDDDNYYNYETDDEGAMTATHGVSGLINIYFTNSVVSSSSGNGLCGYAYFPGGPDTILMDNSCATNGSTLPHEMGHFFALQHTHGPSNSQLTDELVDGSNCATAGDFICDTPADPQLSYSNVTAACNYIGTVFDANNQLFAPDPTNIMSYSRKVCRTYFSPQQYARIYATYQVARDGYTCPTFNVDFASNENTTCDPSLTVNFTDNSVGATSWQWDVDGDDVIDYTTQNPSHTYNSPGLYDVALTVSDGINSISKVNFEYIQVGALESLPVDVDYNDISNSNSNGWISETLSPSSTFSWLASSGGTPSDNTGPIADNSPAGDGIFIYAEATGSNFGDRTAYISPCIDINASDAMLEFSYHMYGASMGELHVDIDAGSGYVLDVTTPIIGQQQTLQTDPYLNRTIDLSSYQGQTIKVRFRAIRGPGFTSDIAIDDFQITGTLSVDDFDSNSISIYPNPVNTGTLNVQSQNALQLDYEVVNLLGQQIQKGTISNEQIDVSQMSAGSYFLILKSEGRNVVKKFIKL
ncbi:T9SS type A sorting domain-containing protein [Winogradskyella sp. 3972H.M.0a.05]|uniref:T9SS type A sorting domain-containing protein n=1 Tax=Winogradskyella sp. 3972H.M.0a.05 TaxID=2950277 RepID=UPI0033945928